MRAVFAGGGTAGHIIPGIVVGKMIMRRRPGSSVLFLTEKSGMRFTPLAISGFSLKEITAGGVIGKSPAAAAGSLLCLFKGFFESIYLLNKFRPNVIIGLGGFASAPVVCAGLVLRRKVILLEQNFVPGLATKLFSRFADEIELSFPGSERHLGPGVRYSVTGNPVREEILSADRKASLATLGLSEERPVLAVMGGSLGARSINDAMEAALKKPSARKKLAGWQIIHLAGGRDHERLAALYAEAGISARVYPFMDEIWHAYATADLLVARSGGNTVAEAAARGVPAVYVPYPWAAGNHQEHNAKAVCGAGGGVMIRDGELSSGKFEEVLFPLLADGERRREMALCSAAAGRPEAAGAVFRRIQQLTGGAACLKR